MKIKKIKGLYNQGVDPIEGTPNLYYRISTSEELYDVKSELIPYNEVLHGNEISFFVYPECRIYTPFSKRKGVYYQHMSVKYYKGEVYFLQGDFNTNLINLFKWKIEDDSVELVTSLDINEVSLYNLSIYTKPIMISAEDIEKNTEEIYYPERLSLKLNELESFYYRDGENFYFSRWHEEGNKVGEYKYWEEYVIRDREGNLIEEGKGDITLMPDGTFLIL